SEFKQASMLADETMRLLDQISQTAGQLIDEKERVVNETIESVSVVLVFAACVISFIILVTWFSLKSWTNRGLRNVLTRLSALTEHDFRDKAEEVGPYELKEVARK
ncbi:methyl-accepting chemotaxis protein, partial [Vibrio parahaemolyticus]|nr:methyl-accepting chemotaxis protein [Vibrio parahaemolyticus]